MEEILEVYVQDADGDVKEAPQTVKDLFSDFKPSSEAENLSAADEEEEEESEVIDEDDSVEPASKKSKQSDNGTPKKRLYPQRYRKEWENIPAYKSWLSESVLGNLYFYCKFCKNNNRCGRTEIDKHMISKKHIRNEKVPAHKVQRKFTFRGLLCSVFTPFVHQCRSNEINYGIIRDYAKFLAKHGVNGILINDMVGEGMSLTPTERMKITETWAKACTDTKQHLMVQVGGAPFKQVQEMVQHAEKKKVSAIVVLPDLYNKPKDHLDLMRYLKVVSDNATSVPLLYHHNPSYTNVNIDMSQFLSDILGEISSFVGIIHSDDNLKSATSALQVNQHQFLVIMGTDEGMLGAFASGFNSIMGTSLNFLPTFAQTISELVKKGNTKEARETQHLLNDILEAIYRHGDWLPAMKTAMNLLSGLNLGAVREPLVPLWQDKIPKMKSNLDQLKASSWNQCKKEPSLTDDQFWA